MLVWFSNTLPPLLRLAHSLPAIIWQGREGRLRASFQDTDGDRIRMERDPFGITWQPVQDSTLQSYPHLTVSSNRWGWDAVDSVRSWQLEVRKEAEWEEMGDRVVIMDWGDWQLLDFTVYAYLPLWTEVDFPHRFHYAPCPSEMSE